MESSEILCLKVFLKPDLSTVHISSECLDCHSAKIYLPQGRKFLEKRLFLRLEFQTQVRKPETGSNEE